MKTLPFEPAPGSLADLDYALWQKYRAWCIDNRVRASVKGYLLWLEEGAS